jgi:ABC-2 type transport system ATP-binding protein
MSVVVEHLSKYYGEQMAVDDISFQVGKGEILGFLGPNGAGKSTTMKMLTGYLPPASGKIEIGGIDMLQHPIEGRRHIGYLPEHNPLYLDMYVKEFLHFVAGTYSLGKQTKEAVKRVIEMIGLGAEAGKTIRQLSKGYRQRVGLAQALIHDPEVLILDEPTTGLDPLQLAEIRSLIKSLGKTKTILFSTHIMQEVQAVCDRVVIIHKGKLVADSTIEGLNASISGQSSVLIQFEKPITTSLKDQSEIVDLQMIQSGTYRAKGNDLLALKKALFRLAVEEDNPILELKEEKAGLEDVFRQLTAAQ